MTPRIHIQAPFDLEIDEQLAGDIPSEVVRRCRGKQTPINPHAQRLLVAATKEAKTNAKCKKDKGETKETKETKREKKQKPSGEESKTSGGKTPYAVAKDRFVAEFLDCVST